MGCFSKGKKKENFINHQLCKYRMDSNNTRRTYLWKPCLIWLFYWHWAVKFPCNGCSLLVTSSPGVARQLIWKNRKNRKKHIAWWKRKVSQPVRKESKKERSWDYSWSYKGSLTFYRYKNRHRRVRERNFA